MKKIYLFLILIFLFAISGCQDWVTDLEPTNDKVTDEAINIQINIDFMIQGLINRTSSLSETFLDADGLSDALYFDAASLPGSTFSSYLDLDNGTPLDDNSNVASAFDYPQRLRMVADTLVYKCLNLIQFSNDATGTTLKNKGLFNGYMFGGYARYLLAAYFGIDKITGGTVINKSGYIPSATIFQQALAKFTESLKYTTDAYSIRLVNSLMARTYLMMGDYTNASASALKGLVKGDKPFIASYNTENDNLYRVYAGEYRDQFALDKRFNDYIVKSADEAKRIILVAKTYLGKTYYRQMKYFLSTTGTIAPIELIDYQETDLIRAELTLRGVASGDPLTMVNEVRTSHTMTALPAGTAITLSTAGTVNIYDERDKELYIRGNRLLDQRRFGKFHIVDGWQYFPLPRGEKVRNPNIPQ